MSELKPCPFCGGQIARTDCEGDSCINSFYCDKCPVEFTVPHHTTDAAYVVMWNTRTPPTLPPVSPEDLVEGEVYIARDALEREDFVRFDQRKRPSAFGDKYVGWFQNFGEEDSVCHGDTRTYYGPLRFKIGGAK